VALGWSLLSPLAAGVMLEPKKPKDAYRVYELVEGALSSRVDFGDVTNTGNERLLRAAPASVFDGEVDCSGGCYPLAGSKTLSLQSDAGAFDVSGSRALLGRLSPFRAINHDKSDNWKARLHPELEEGLFLVDEDAMFFTFLKNGKLHVLPRDPGDASDEYHGSKRDEEDDDAVKQRRFVWSLDELVRLLRLGRLERRSRRGLDGPYPSVLQSEPSAAVDAEYRDLHSV
jgi:hypothetical protein